MPELVLLLWKHNWFHPNSLKIKDIVTLLLNYFNVLIKCRWTATTVNWKRWGKGTSFMTDKFSRLFIFLSFPAPPLSKTYFASYTKSKNIFFSVVFVVSFLIAFSGTSLYDIWTICTPVNKSYRVKQMFCIFINIKTVLYLKSCCKPLFILMFRTSFIASLQTLYWLLSGSNFLWRPRFRRASL